MNKVIKIILGALLGALFILQFFRGEYPETSVENSGDLFLQYEVESEIQKTVKTACYDCHSQETTYPWYSKIAPVSWLIIRHVNEGREGLNFSIWSDLDKRKKIRKLNDIAEVVEELEMPLSSYTLLHGEADLTPEQRQQLVDWVNDLAKQVLRE